MLFLLTLKVCISDIQQKKGEDTTSEFKKEYGQESCFFVKCDVTNVDDWKSKAYRYFMYLLYDTLVD